MCAPDFSLFTDADLLDVFPRTVCRTVPAGALHCELILPLLPPYSSPSRVVSINQFAARGRQSQDLRFVSPRWS